MNNVYAFEGDFDLLPFRAHVLYGAVPTHPIEDDFHTAVSVVFDNPDDAAAHWHVEAVRERRLNPGAALSGDTMKRINLRVAARLYERAMETAQ